MDLGWLSFRPSSISSGVFRWLGLYLHSLTAKLVACSSPLLLTRAALLLLIHLPHEHSLVYLPSQNSTWELWQHSSQNSLFITASSISTGVTAASSPYSWRRKVPLVLYPSGDNRGLSGAPFPPRLDVRSGQGAKLLPLLACLQQDSCLSGPVWVQRAWNSFIFSSIRWCMTLWKMGAQDKLPSPASLPKAVDTLLGALCFIEPWWYSKAVLELEAAEGQSLLVQFFPLCSAAVVSACMQLT